ncbi:uncharacterized protein PAC_17225 [Phialocephala subalpina]|uniref:Uncharacterized protein n=1 Tax=Phialocephala subalpina TaxID=576137 RepID=A0A1L7XQJ9_9HELO|nr:uncharacterized protein PAC_17225 [Phialocephala subalpina]
MHPSKDVLRLLRNTLSPSKVKSRKSRKSKRIKDKNTYAFVIEIANGEDYHGRDNVDVLALYNESCNYNYISAKFARRLRIIGDTYVDRDLKLVWACKRLGRYQQRSVFWIAKHADFDLLFGQEKEANVLEFQDSQFQRGIQNGILSTSFEEGIRVDCLWRVEHSTNDSNSDRAHEMPSLADIQNQLAVELDSTPGRTLKHENMKAFNVSDISHPCCLETPMQSVDCKLTTSAGTVDEDIDVIPSFWPTTFEDPTASMVMVFQGKRRNGRPYLSSASKDTKGIKRTHPDHDNALSEDTMAGVPRKPKVRRSLASIQPPENAALVVEDSPCQNDIFPPDSLRYGITISSVNSDRYPCHKPTNPELFSDTSNWHRSVCNSSTTVDTLLLAGMVRDDALHDKKVTSDDGSISLSVRSNSPLETEPSTNNETTCDAETSTNAYRRKIQSREVFPSEHVDLNFSTDWSDKKFNEYWTRDEEVGKLYHLDESTGMKTWYEAPPWSTGSPTI